MVSSKLVKLIIKKKHLILNSILIDQVKINPFHNKENVTKNNVRLVLRNLMQLTKRNVIVKQKLTEANDISHNESL